MARLLRLPLAVVIAATIAAASVDLSRDNPFLRLPSERDGGGVADEDGVGTRWAILIAGSYGYYNYRHQADVCHAYQVLRKGGLKDENIIVFMYDDIANDFQNPEPGTIINRPKGENVYAGVPKDYTGDDVSVDNLFAVILGNRSAVTGGSGKVVESGPDDHIFIFYSDHGGPGVLGMPTYPYLYADDLMNVLQQKHEMKGYKSMVFYLEACESGSIFEGLLPTDINIYATTASNAVENSWGTYCPGDPGVPHEYNTCLGDLYSVSWMEDSDIHNLRTESLKQQYRLVKKRTSVHGTYHYGSHVMEYGDLNLNSEHLFSYIGTNPANDDSPSLDNNSLHYFSKAVNQRDADLIYFWEKYRKFAEGSSEKMQAQKELLEVLEHRLHLDKSVESVGNLLFGSEKGPEILKSVRTAGLPLVDDWSCLKAVVRAFEGQCGSLSQYGMKHMRSFANICNAGVREESMAKVAALACPTLPTNPWSSLERGFSAQVNAEYVR